MKRFGLVTVGSVLLSTGVIADSSENSNVTYTVDAEKSNVTWTGKKVTGKHYGNVNIEKGEIIVRDGIIVKAAIALDMNTITNIDLTDEQWNKKLVDHLKSDDFFYVEKNPTATFILTKIIPIENSNENDENFTIVGDLTIKGITHQLRFPANVEVKSSKITVKGTAKIDRTKYDIRYGSGSFFKGLGDNMIYNEFEIGFNITSQISDSDLEVVEQ